MIGLDDPTSDLLDGGHAMQRSPRFARRLGLAVVAVWLVSPPWLVRAQPTKADPVARPGEKTAEEDKGPPRISVQRLQVVKPEPAPANMPPGFPRRNRFGFMDSPPEGTSLTFVLDEPQQSIISVETEDCKITTFRDDRGTDLIPDENEMQAARRNAAMNPRFGQDEAPISAEVDSAGHRATITVHSPRLPAGGANRILLETILVIRYAKGEKTVEQKNVDLKLDKLVAGPYSLVVASQDDANRGFGQRGGTQLLLFHQGPMRDLKKIAFIGPDGQEIKATVSGSGQSGSTYHTNYSLSKKVETCTIRLTVPDAIETVHMAVTINTGVGFPAGARRRIIPAPEPRPAVTGASPR
jgi:hypothetical protein